MFIEGVSALMNLKNLLSDNLNIGPCVVGIGTFDGVHVAHRKLVEEVIEKAKQLGLPSVIFTFDHSPKVLLNPDAFPGYLTTTVEKFNLLFSLGVDYVVFRTFDCSFANLTYMEFIDDILIDKLNAKLAIVGFNFFFGLDQQGSAKILHSEMKSKGRDCKIIEPVEIEGETVSSSAIRRALAKGDFETCNKLLGRVASLSGEVVHGDHRGREMGFPTANLLLEKREIVLPPNGVYGCYVDTHKGSYPALVNVGYRPTFNKKSLILEAHLLGFSGDLYHRVIRVRFLTRVRDEKKFPDMSSLIMQIEKDELFVKTYLEELN